MKNCTKCHQDKDEAEFIGKNGQPTAQCASCREIKLKWHHRTKAARVDYVRLYDQQYHSKNRERSNQRCRQYYQQNKAAVVAWMNQYKQSDPERSKKWVRDWNKTERGRLSRKKAQAKREQRKKKTDITRRWLMALYETAIMCPLCSCELNDDGSIYPNGKHLDHTVPLNVGGMHIKSNVRVVCFKCNTSRPKDGSDINTDPCSVTK